METDATESGGGLESNEEFNSAATAAAADPGDGAAWDTLEEFAASTGQPDPISAVYRKVLGGDLSSDIAPDLAQRAVNFHEEWYSESSPVLVEVFSRVLEVDPTASEWAFQRLTVVHTVAERWDELLSLYDREIERTPDTHRRASLLEEAAQTAKDFAGAPDRAAAYLLELFELRPKDRALASSLERLLERQERYADLVRLWRGQAIIADATEASELRLRIAEALFDRLEQPGDALEELKALLDGDGDPDGPMEMLERIVRDERVDPDARRDALTILRQTYDATGRSTDVIGTLDTALRLASDDERVALHRDAARRLREAGDYGAAMGHLSSLLALAPGDDEALAELREVAPQTETPGHLIEVLIQAADAATDGPLSARLRNEVVDRLAEAGEHDRAIAQLKLVTEVEGLTQEASREARRRYTDLLRAAGRREEELSALELLAEVEDTRGAKRNALVAAARLARELEQPDRAIAAWEATLEVDPKDLWALEEIVAILAAEERHEDLIKTLRRRAESGVPDFQRRSDLRRIAEVQADGLALVADAIATWNEIGASYGEDTVVVDALVDLYARAERWEDRAEVLERAAQRDDAHVSTLRALQGDTFANHLGNKSGALRAYRRALEADERHEGARQGLAQLSEDEELGAVAVEALARSYETTDEWQSLLALLDQRLAATSDSGRKLELLSQAAVLQEERASSPAMALASVGRAFELAPERVSLEAEVDRLTEASDDESALATKADILAGAAAAASDSQRSGQLRSREVEVRRGIGDDAGAFTASLEALANRPRNIDDARNVVALGEATEQLEQAEEALRTAAEDPNASDELIEMLAGVQRTVGSEGLPTTLRRMVERRPADLDGLVEIAARGGEGERQAYEELYARATGLWRAGREAIGEHKAPEQSLIAARWLAEQLEDDPQASSLLLAEVSRLPLESDEAADWLRRAARKAREADDTARAMALFREVLERTGEDAEALEALGTLYQEQGRNSELLDLRRRELKVVEDPERRVQLRLEVARLVTDIDVNGGRLEALQENLKERPGHHESLAALEQFLTSRRDYGELAGVLETQAGLIEGERAASLWAQVAMLSEEHLQDVDRALEAHRRVVDLSPEDVGALDALARIQQDRGEAAAASRWLERRLAAAGDEERADVALNLARTLLEAGRVERACEVLEDARQHAEDREELRTLLANEYRKQGNFAPLAKVLADSAERTSDRDEVLGFVREAAKLYRDEIGAPSQAIPVLRKARDLAPDDREIELMLAEGLRDAGEFDEARTILEKVIGDFGRRRSSDRAQVHYDLAIVARAQGDLAGALEQLELASKMAAAAPRVLQMLGRMAREAGELDRAEKAYRALLMTVRRQTGDNIDVGSAEVLYELHALARDRGEDDQAEELRESALEAAAQSDAEAFRFRDNLASRGEEELVLAALDRRVEVAGEDASKAKALAAMADVLESMERREEATWRRLVALDHAPGDMAIHEATLRAMRQDGDVAAYVKKLEEVIETRRRDNDADLLARLLVVLGNVREVDFGDLDEATTLYGRAEALLDAPVDAWVALARVGAAREDIPLQRRVLTELVDVADLAEGVRADSLHQLAGIQLRDAGGLDDAVATARRAFDLDPRHQALAAALESAVARTPDHAEAMRLYEEVARDSTDDEVLLTFLERRAAGPEVTLPQVREGIDKARAMEAYARLEALLERAAEVASASEEGPTAARAILLELSQRRTEQGDGPGAIRYAKMAVETAEFDDERRELELQLANAAATNNVDLELAAEVYSRLLEADPMDETVWRPLLRVHAARNDEDRLNDLVSFLVDGLLDPGLRNEARMQRARWLMNTEGREFDAVDTLKTVLDEQPEHTEAADLLASLYEKSGYSEDLVELLERQLDVARDHEDLEQIAEYTIKLGELLDKVRREDAMDTYRRALDWVPENRPIIERYLALFGPEDDAREKALLRERLLGIETGEAASALARSLYEEWAALEDHEAMVRTLALGYRANPADDGIRGQLENYYREAERHAELADFLAMDAERVADDKPAAIQRLREAATIRRDTLGDAAGAVELLQKAHEAVGGEEILGELVVALQAAGRSDEAEATIGAAIEAYEARDVGYVQLLVSRARVRTTLGRLGEARADLEEAYEISAPHAAAELVEVLVTLRDEASASGDQEAQREAVFRLVTVLRAASEDQQARDVLAHWTEVDASDIEALQLLRDIELERQDWNGVVNVCHRLVQVLEGEEQLQAANLLADAAASAGVPEHARGGLEFVHNAQPTDAGIIERLRALYTAIGANAELAGLCLREADATEDAQRAFELEREAGRLYVEVNDGTAALEALRRARERMPDDHETTVLLADAYIASEMFAEAGQLLEDAINRHTRRRSPELSELQHRMAKLAQGAGDRSLQMQWLSAALESDKNNGHVAAELAQLAWEEGDADVALQALRAVTLSRTEGPMSRAKAFLMQARIAHQRGEARRALLWARKAKSEDPNLDGVDGFLAELGDS